MDRRNVPGGGVKAPHPKAMASSAPVGGGREIKSLADLNRRNQDAHQPVPLPARDLDGQLVDPRFTVKADDPMFPKKKRT